MDEIESKGRGEAASDRTRPASSARDTAVRGAAQGAIASGLFTTHVVAICLFYLVPYVPGEIRPNVEYLVTMLVGAVANGVAIGAMSWYGARRRDRNEEARSLRGSWI